MTQDLLKFKIIIGISIDVDIDVPRDLKKTNWGQVLKEIKQFRRAEGRSRSGRNPYSSFNVCHNYLLHMEVMEV